MAVVKSSLVDQFQRPIVYEDLAREVAGPSLTGIRQIIGGHPAQGLTPQRLAALLKEAEGGDATRYLELAEEMEEKDLHYLGVLGTRKRAVAQLEITVDAATDDARHVAHADELRDWLSRDLLEDELFDILDGIGKGYSASEIMWQTSERQWWPARLELRDPRWFEFDRASGRRLLLRDLERESSADNPAAAELPPFKFVVHQPRAKSGLPIRGGIARAVSWTYLFKNFDIKDWVVFANAYGHPLRLGKYGPGATQDEKATLLRAVANIASDAAAIIPQGMEIEFVEAKLSGNIDLFEKFANWLDQQVSKAVLGQTGTTDAIAGGYAGNKVHNEVREDIERSDASQLAATLNRDLIRPYIDLNHGPQDLYPRLRIGRRENVDTDKLSQALQRLVPLGLKVGMSTIRDKLGLPDPVDDEELLMPAVKAAPALSPSGLPVPGAPQPGEEEQAAAAQLAGRTGDSVDQLVERLAQDTAQDMEAMIGTIRDLVETSASLDEVAQRLVELYPRLQGGALADAMAQAMLTAELAGRAGIAVP